MSVLNATIQNLAPEWVRARVLAFYLLVFGGSIAVGSALEGNGHGPLRHSRRF
jgi:hypothetical protein